ncbi:MAG: DUF5668 domain-containing protein [Candidatus Latescibacterota bacterium]
MAQRKSIHAPVSGLILIAAGILLLLHNLDLLDFDFGEIWPIIVAAIGAFLLFSVWGRPDKGMVLPGTILLLSGVFFFFWQNGTIPRGMGNAWPACVVIVGIAFIVLCACQRQEKGRLIFGVVLLFVGGVFLVDNYVLLPWDPWKVIFKSWPLVLILIGVTMIWKERRKTGD